MGKIEKTITITKNNKMAWIDTLKVISAIGVILIHFSEVSIGVWDKVSVLTLLPRISVQLFFLIGGVTLYSRYKLSVAYSINKFIYLLTALIIFRFALYVYNQENSHFWNQAMVNTGNYLWYLYTIIPIYTMSSIIRPPELHSQKEVKTFLVIAILTMLLFCSSTAPGMLISIYIPGRTHGHTSILTALVYMSIGYGLGQLNTKGSPLFYGIFSALSITFYIIYSKFVYVTYQFTAVHLLVASIMFFLFIKQLRLPPVIQNVFSRLAPYTLHVYGFHIIAISLGNKISFYQNSTLLEFVFVVTVSFAISFITTPLHKKIIQCISLMIQASLKILRRKNVINNNSLL